MGKMHTVINTIINETINRENNENNGRKGRKQFGGCKCAGALEKSSRRPSRCRSEGRVGADSGAKSAMRRDVASGR